MKTRIPPVLLGLILLAIVGLLAAMIFYEKSPEKATELLGILVQTVAQIALSGVADGGQTAPVPAGESSGE